MSKKKKVERVEVEAEPAPSERVHDEPWAPQAMVVEALLDYANTYVSNYSKRQAKGLAEARAVMELISRYIVRESTWLQVLVREFERRNKFIGGWAVKQAVKVARSSSTRFLLNLSRWRKMFVGGEEEIED